MWNQIYGGGLQHATHTYGYSKVNALTLTRNTNFILVAFKMQSKSGRRFSTRKSETRGDDITHKIKVMAVAFNPHDIRLWCCSWNAKYQFHGGDLQHANQQTDDRVFQMQDIKFMVAVFNMQNIQLMTTVLQMQNINFVVASFSAQETKLWRQSLKCKISNSWMLSPKERVHFIVASFNPHNI